MSHFSRHEVRAAISAAHAKAIICRVMAVVIVLSFNLASSLASMADEKLPKSGDNNVWYTKNDADTVFVFVHGVFSDSRSAWARTEDSSTNWPKLIDEDPKFKGPSIFLGGYYSDSDAGNYDMRDAANWLYRNLTIEGVLDKPKIIFIAHSTGGIVVRHMLVRKKEKFTEKKVGLVLIASPSLGSRDATRFKIIAELARHRLSQELQWDDPFLRELDKDFKNLVNKRELPALTGTEWLENHYVGGELGKLFGLARDKLLVEEASAARYFGEPIRLANTTHTNAVKPDNLHHPAHKNLQFFYLEEFLAATDPRQEHCQKYQIKYAEIKSSLKSINDALSNKREYMSLLQREHASANNQSIPYGDSFYEINAIIAQSLSNITNMMFSTGQIISNLELDKKRNENLLDDVVAMMEKEGCNLLEEEPDRSVNGSQGRQSRPLSQ